MRIKRLKYNKKSMKSNTKQQIGNINGEPISINPKNAHYTEYIDDVLEVNQ